MTFSEFGRQIASNASLGTDHGDAAPLLLFGTCIQSGIIGPNPVIGSAIPDQAGVGMQIDFRNVYASILRDWFQVPSNEVQQLFAHSIQYYSLAGTCNVSIEEEELATGKLLLYPNPTPSSFHVKANLPQGISAGFLLDSTGKVVKQFFEQEFSAGIHHIFCDTAELPSGSYFMLIKTRDKNMVETLIKTK